MRATVLITLCCLCLAGCDQSDSNVARLTKHQARWTEPDQWQGDHCASSGWYGDGECDDFCPEPDQDCDAQAEARAAAFLEAYIADYADKEKALALAGWQASITGDPQAYKDSSDAQIDLFMLHVDAQRKEDLKDLLADRASLALWTRRSLEVVEPSFLAVDVPVEQLGTLLRISQLSNEVSSLFSTHKVELEGSLFSTSELQQMLAQEQDPLRRKQLWEASRQIGAEVASKVVEGIKLGNEVAVSLGCANYWECAMEMSDQDPQQVEALFEEVDARTEQPYAQVKADIDEEVATRFDIDPQQVMIWHYDDPYFMTPPSSPQVDLDGFIEGHDEQAIIDMAASYFDRLGLDVSDVIGRSDLFVRDNKWPSAFMTDIDRSGDIRILLNIRPTHRWISTALHELGHAVDYQLVDPTLPFLLRTANHIMTTEAVAMMFEEQSLHADFLQQVVGVDHGRVQPLQAQILEHHRRDELVFARFALVMFHFEKRLYEDPDQDLNALWWDLVQQYQLVPRPEGRDQPDWACKTHFSTNPVYYHNYLLGKLFGAQLREVLGQQTGCAEPAMGFSFLTAPTSVELLKKTVLRIGKDLHWYELVEHATGEPLKARSFAEQVSQPMN